MPPPIEVIAWSFAAMAFVLIALIAVFVRSCMKDINEANGIPQHYEDEDDAQAKRERENKEYGPLK